MGTTHSSAKPDPEGHRLHFEDETESIFVTRPPFDHPARSTEGSRRRPREDEDPKPTGRNQRRRLAGPNFFLTMGNLTTHSSSSRPDPEGSRLHFEHEIDEPKATDEERPRRWNLPIVSRWFPFMKAVDHDCSSAVPFEVFVNSQNPTEGGDGCHSAKNLLDHLLLHGDQVRVDLSPEEELGGVLFETDDQVLITHVEANGQLCRNLGSYRFSGFVRSVDEQPVHSIAQFESLIAMAGSEGRTYALSLGQIDAKGQLPLHRVLNRRNVPVDLILDMIRSFPAAVEHIDCEGHLPLDVAVLKPADPDVIVEMLRLFPEALRRADPFGRLPLHRALMNHALSHVLAEMILLFPEALRHASASGFLPLHHALRSRAPPDVLAEMLRLFPEALRRADPSGRLPLHHALVRDAPPDVIVDMIRLFPDALRYAGPSGMLPLHDALKKGHAAPKMVPEMNRLFPGALQRAGPSGMLPLHLALRYLATTDVHAPELIPEMIRLFPEALRHADTSGMLPLHYALRRNAGHSLLAKMIRLFPEAVEHTNDRGSLPVHLALRAHIAPEAILGMIERFPRAVECIEPDTNELPLHIAARHACVADPRVILTLIQCFPQALKITQPRTSLLPIHLAVAHGRKPLEVIRAMFHAHPVDVYQVVTSDKSLLDFARAPVGTRGPMPGVAAFLEDVDKINQTWNALVNTGTGISSNQDMYETLIGLEIFGGPRRQRQQ